MNTDQIHELLYQALETEQGGILVYEAAVVCAKNPDLKKEWQEYLEQTRNHERVLLGVFKSLGLDPKRDTPGRMVVRHIGQALVKAMQMARQFDSPAAAQLVAAECVVEAETKDHLNWELLSEVAGHMKGKDRDVLRSACEEVEEQEDEHLYHTTGWARELWIESLGLPAVLPPPEEEKQVKTAIGAARAKQGREEMIDDRH